MGHRGQRRFRRWTFGRFCFFVFIQLHCPSQPWWVSTWPLRVTPHPTPTSILYIIPTTPLVSYSSCCWYSFVGYRYLQPMEMIKLLTMMMSISSLYISNHLTMMMSISCHYISNHLTMMMSISCHFIMMMFISGHYISRHLYNVYSELDLSVC